MSNKKPILVYRKILPKNWVADLILECTQRIRDAIHLYPIYDNGKSNVPVPK